MQVETSPFVFDGPAPPEDVVGRDIEIAALTDRAMHGRFVVLFGPRRFGKTSLIHRVRYEASVGNELAVVLVDFLGVQTMDDIVNRIGRAFQASPDGKFATLLGRRASRRPEISGELGIGPARVGFGRGERPAPALVEDLLQLPYEVAGELAMRALVVMDEFQAVRVVAEAEAVLRATIQHQRDRLSYLFAGSEQSILSAMFAERTAPLYGQAEQFRLGRLRNDDLGELIQAKFEDTGRLPGSALTHLLATAAGHPQRAAFLAHHLWEATAPDTTAGDDEWATAYAEAMRRSQYEFVAVESGLEPGQRRLCRVLAWGEPPYGAAAKRLGLAKGTAASALKALERRSLVWRPYDEDLELVDPLFAAWLRDRDLRP